MKVTDALAKKETLSFEFFPPKTSEQEKRLFEIIGNLKVFKPDFVSVTYGAMGTAREKTFFWVREIKQRFQIEPVAHLTCVAATREDIAAQVDHLTQMGVENILALRGDLPPACEKFNEFCFAKELVSFIRERNPKICIGVAGYPEGHPESPGLEKDIEYLKQKVDAGADYMVTQLFFDNDHYFNFIERCRKAGIAVPVIPGIMPITSYKLLKKMTKVCGATIPPRLLSELEHHRSNPQEISRIGVEQAVKQGAELRKAGAPGLHFFVMNQSGPISEILKQLSAA